MKIIKSKKKYLIMNGYTELASFKDFEDAQTFLASKAGAELKTKYKKGARPVGIKQYQDSEHEVALNLEADYEFIGGRFS